MFQSFQNPTLHYNTSRPPSFPPPFLFCKRRHLRRDCRIFFGGRKFFFGGLVNCWGMGYNLGYRFFKTHKGERNDTFAPPHEFGNRTNLTAFCAAFVRVFSRLFSHQLLAVATVLCGAVWAQPASAYGAYFDYEVEVGGGFRFIVGRFVVNRPTPAQARTDALAECNTAAAAATTAPGRTITRACTENPVGGFNGCINVANGADNNDYFGIGDTPAAARAARAAKHTGAPGGERAACNCGGAMSIIDSNAPSGCRAAIQSDCTGATPILDSGNCRAATQADCTGGTPIFENGNCRARQQSDCTGNTPILDGGNCRARQASDCTGGTPILANGACRAAANQGECNAKDSSLVFVAGGTCRDRVAGDCTGNTPIFVSASKTCRAAIQSDCTGGTPILANGACRAAANQGECNAKDSSLVFVAGGTCRDRVAGDCTGNTPIFVSASKTCRAAIQSDCTGNTPIFESGNCRAATQADCTGGTPIFENGNCRARQQSDCTGNTPILDGGNCRARQASDCTGNTPILDSGSCRAATQADCTGGTPILDSGACRARQQSDCTGNTPILDSGSCRAATQADCTGNRPIFENGNCRARQASDCTGATPILHNGACVATRPTPPITPTPTPPTTGSATSTSSGKAKGSFPEAIGGFAAVAGIAWYFSIHDGTPLFGAVQWSPHYSFAMSGGLRRYEVGSRWEWKRDNFVAHWTATKTASDSFAYGSGAKWTGDIFTAAFNSQETGKDTELDFSLLAKKEFGVWSFSPQYRVNFDRDETDETWRHSLALRAVWTADKWTLSNSAGFHGESLAAFGDNASAKVLLRREF